MRTLLLIPSQLGHFKIETSTANSSPPQAPSFITANRNNNHRLWSSKYLHQKSRGIAKNKKKATRRPARLSTPNSIYVSPSLNITVITNSRFWNHGKRLTDSVHQLLFLGNPPQHAFTFSRRGGRPRTAFCTLHPSSLYSTESKWNHCHYPPVWLRWNR